MPQQGQQAFLETPIDLARLCEEDYLMVAMIPIFARGVSPYAGKMTDPVAWISAGMKQVFDWWCSSGMGCGEPDMLDAAADVAYLVAAHVYSEADTLQSAFDRLTPYMLSRVESCKGRQAVSFEPMAP